MKKTLIALVLVCLIVSLGAAQSTAPAPAPASASEAPDIVMNGFKALETKGYIPALDVWTQNSVLGLDKNAIANLNKFFLVKTTTGYGGTFTGSDIIRTVNLSQSTEMVYAVATYQHEELFMSFTCFRPRPTDKWVVNTIAMNNDPSKILPTNILGGM